MFSRRLLGIIAALSLLSTSALAGFITPVKPFSKRVGQTPIGVVKAGEITMPLITWGGDVLTLFANGGVTTQKNSIFAQKKLKLKLKLQDNFVEQVQAYMKGESPFLRGTLGMINAASEVLNKDPRTQPVVILQLTWSTGGDCLVVRGVNSVKDLKGKKIVLQQYSPHMDFLDKVLGDAGLSSKDVKILWVEELTGGKNDPASAFKKDKSISAAFCISPDAIALAADDAEDGKDGASILFDTRTANRMIADVIAVRRDFFEANKQMVKDLTFGYLETAQKVKQLSKNKKFISKAAAFFMGSESKTDDIEGLLADCTVQLKDDNFSFFQHEGNLVGFEPTNKRIQRFLKREGYISENAELEHAKWNYGVKKAEIKIKRETAAPKSIPEAVVTLFEFEIKFDPNQHEFSAAKYGKAFARTLDLASHYGGAMLEIVGHVDPTKINKMRAEGGRPMIIKRMSSMVTKLSSKRAKTVKKTLLKYAKEKGTLFDESQFMTKGMGIKQPRHKKPKNDAQKADNRRVVFRVLNVLIE